MGATRDGSQLPDQGDDGGSPVRGPSAGEREGLEWAAFVRHGSDGIPDDLKAVARQAGVGPIELATILVKTGIYSWRLARTLEPVLGKGTAGHDDLTKLLETLKPLFGYNSPGGNVPPGV